LTEEFASEDVFTDKEKFLAAAGGIEGIAQAMTMREVTAFRASVDAASLVFMHSTLDDAAQNLCRVTALVTPADWRQFVDNRGTELSEIRAKGYEAVADQKVDSLLERLSRELLVKKVDKLFQVCKPDRSYTRVDYEFNRDRLVELDSKRHDVVHGGGQLAPIPDIEDSVNYLLETGLYLFGLVNHRYGVRMSPDALLDH